MAALLASSAGGNWIASRAGSAQAASAARVYEFHKTRVINVPIVSDGALEGYVIVQFLYAIDARAAETLNVSPDAYLMDRAFRTLYGDPRLDFRQRLRDGPKLAAVLWLLGNRQHARYQRRPGLAPIPRLDSLGRHGADIRRQGAVGRAGAGVRQRRILGRAQEVRVGPLG